MGVETNDIESQVMGMTGEDIVLSPLARKIIPYSFECKNQERLNIWSALHQTKKNSDGRVPVLVFTKNREDIYVSITLTDFIDLIERKPDVKNSRRSKRTNERNKPRKGRPRIQRNDN